MHFGILLELYNLFEYNTQLSLDSNNLWESEGKLSITLCLLFVVLTKETLLELFPVCESFEGSISIFRP